jgi:hypothetical protein
MTKKLVLLGAAALLLSQLAVAGTVTYTTSGTFSSSSTSTSAVMPVTFNGTTQTISTPTIAAILGSFSIGTFGKCKKSLCTTTDDLTLTITQGTHFGNLTATVEGDVTFNSKTGVVSWVFTPPATVFIHGVTYKGLPGNSDAGTTVFGIVTGTVPEPNARLLLGLGTFGLMGLTLVSRKLLTI